MIMGAFVIGARLFCDDGMETVRFFADTKDLLWFVHNEGDHLQRYEFIEENEEVDTK